MARPAVFSTGSVMVRDGWVATAIRAELMERVDRLVEKNRDGYSSRADVIQAALREFLAKHEPKPPV